MRNVTIMLAALFGGFGTALALGAPSEAAGRYAIAAVFAFTGFGHFVRSREMTALLPASIPGRHGLILVSGMLELAFSVLVVMPRYSYVAGVSICFFLVLVTPLNVLAAIRKVDFGGHGAGVGYLWIRLPLQVLLIVWTFWFTIRS